MAAAALMEQELQHSMATSEEDADYEEDDEAVAANADAFAANKQLHNGMLQGRGHEGDNEDEDAEGDSDEDAEGEEDDEMADAAQNNDDDEEDEEDEEDDDEDDDEDGEGVGAVKIQPGLSEDDDEDVLPGSDEESAASVDDADDDDESKDSTDAEVEAQWEPAAEEEDEEPTNPNRCMYVLPSTKFLRDTDGVPDSVCKTKKTIPVRSLSCTYLVKFVVIMVCFTEAVGIHKADEAIAHRQCARNANALKSDEGMSDNPLCKMLRLLTVEIQKQSIGCVQNVSQINFNRVQLRKNRHKISLPEGYQGTEFPGIFYRLSEARSSPIPIQFSIS
jgi:histone acetyltransferase SAS3